MNPVEKDKRARHYPPILRMPPPVRRGDVIHVVAPSGPFEPCLGWRGLGWLTEHYDVRFDRSIFRVQGYLAGDDKRRGQELCAALESPEVRAVVAMRGGYGLSRIAHVANWSRFAEHPKWIVGFSDITTLHIEAAAVGIMSLHAPMVAQLGQGWEKRRVAWQMSLEHPEHPREWTGLQSVKQGEGEGILFGGNLTVLHASIVAGRAKIPKGAVLLLEDVGERPYRLDRMVATMIVGGHLRDISAIILGEFTDCTANADGVCADEVLCELLLPLGVPVVAKFPVGHGWRNEPVVLGSRAHVHAGRDSACVKLSFEE